MPGCKTCFERFNAGLQGGVPDATRVRAGLTWDVAETGEGLFCEEHAPEGSVDIDEWMADIREAKEANA
jgi:hypothetical protein